MDTLDQHIELDTDKLKINNSIKENLITAAKWARFLAIIGFVFTGFMGIASLFLLVTAMASGIGMLMLMAVVYIGLTLVMIFPALYLIRFAGSTEKGLNANKQGEFDYGIQNLKSLFKFTGIYTIVVIALYIVYIFALAQVGFNRVF
jgi:predicted RND superfamily exporter protein